MSELIEIIYASLASPETGAAEVQALLAHAHEKNIREGVTGLLCFDGERYLQLIEGEAAAIDGLYAKIEVDPRHYDVEMLHRGKISDRAFPDWRMAYENVPAGMLESLSENMAVMSMMDADEAVLDVADSYGTRMFALFMKAAFVAE